MNGRNLSVWIIVLAVPAAVYGQQFDTVMGSRGTSSYGTITKVTREQVTIDTNQGQKLFPVNEIQKVSFSGEPRELRSARDGILKGQLAMARADLVKINVDAIDREEIKQDIEFYKAFCDGREALVGGGDKIAAGRAMSVFLAGEEKRHSFHYFEAVELLGDLYVAIGSYPKGIEYYGLLGKAPWPDYQMKAALLEAGALLATEQYADALAKYNSVLASPIDDVRAREQKQEATLGSAVCQATAGQVDAGIASILKIIEQNDSREKPVLFAKAYNALGVCYLKAGKTQDALLAFLHVDLLFNQDPNAHAEALYYLISLWRDVNKSERSIQADSLLKSRYSGSPWANKDQR